MHGSVLICWTLLVLVGADECPDGGRCEEGQTCCNDPTDSYECCPFDQAECCKDHIHCCPTDTVCDSSTSGCVNATVSVPWRKRVSADQPGLSKSFRMIKTYTAEEDDNICPDQSRCPAEFSCLKASKGFGCCPVSQGVACSDGNHCCPEAHRCSADGRSCIKNDLVTTVLCGDRLSECPGDTTCCEAPEGTWGCCPMPRAVCCSDNMHCCPEGTTCDVLHFKCTSLSTGDEMPMWAKLPARIREEWENQKVHNAGTEKVPEGTTDNSLPPSGREVSVSSVTKAAKGNPVSCNKNTACPDGTTCCKTQEGGWSCCPLPESVPGNDVQCDKTAACADGTTCCKTQEGGWACCPMPEAVCCEDFIHCCPKGKKCNVAAGTCDDGLFSQTWVEKVPAIPRQSVPGNDVQCDKTAACADGTTCCKTQEGGWACCPMPEAVCCEDFIHCCPKGKKCNVAAGTCDDGLFSQTWVEKVPAIPRQSVPGNDVQCDKTTACADGTTCCKTQEGGWACCLLPEAVCCEDFIHCCPKGKKCNMAAGTCDDGLFSQTWVEKVPAIPRQSVRVMNVPCNDTAACADGTTCCKTQEGGWACCPMPEAVCCEDFIHCCPKGKKCNVAAGTCDDGLFSQTWVEKVPVTPRQSVPGNDVQCDKTAACADGTTCCKTQEGGWACCPMPEAVCCEDFIHCCPKGKKCNVAAGTCDDGLFSQTWVEKVPAIPRQSVRVMNVPCNDTAACADGTTCCKTQEGGWACCPTPEAVCCEDFIHCCPKGKKCNMAAGTCDDGLFSQTWVEKVPAIPRQSVRVMNVPCNDTAACADGTTCCKTQEGGWACCPTPEAVCCEDFIHCCPKGKKCNVAAGTCDDGLFSQTWVEKVPVTPRQSVPGNDVQCDKTAACADGTTCCKTQEGGWACCPMPEAVCCEDFIHCCPKGKKCNVAAGTCDDGLFSQTWVEKVPAIPRQSVRVMNVPCNDTAACADGTTCCKTQEGGWACCPTPEAVCCEDFIHCCPKGKKCNVAAGTCDDGLFSQTWVEKVPVTPRQSVPGNDVQCDKTAACADGTTCCKTQEGGWACCPMPEAVCCEDFIHCCPKGKKCNVAAGTCDDGLFSQTWVEKVPAIPRQSVRVMNVPCNDTAACADGTTCCKTQEGGWACCPTPEAVCCEDFIHCCPKGKKCNVAAGTCDDGLFSQTWVEKVPVTPRQSVPGNDVQCDKTAACPDGTTCCKTQEGGWACCPMPEAVCCEDFIHCCPKGKKCNMAAGTCDDGLFSQTWVEKVPAIPRQSVRVMNVPCNDTAACADGTTCCKNKVGDWACCPMPQAVCCDDHEHCCPAGTTCNATSTGCDHASGSTPMKRKTPAFLTSTKQREEEKPEEDKVMKTQEEDDKEQGSNKCDAETSCPQHTTCCFMTSSHRWGCCPLPDAVCCAGGRHCCPAHYRCNESRTSCVKGDVEVPWYAKRPADPRSVHCDDGSQCPVDSTCCRLLTREWGCCPLKNAVCCADMKRCCPSGHTCTAAGSCAENAGPSWHDWRFLSGDKTKKSAPVL